MIRFKYDPLQGENLAFEHFTIEGDNKRGYVLLAYSDDKPFDPDGFDDADGPDARGAEMLQLWFETLGEALTHSADELGIGRDSWNAPNTALPSGTWKPTTRTRPGKEGKPLNPDAGNRDHPSNP